MRWTLKLLRHLPRTLLRRLAGKCFQVEPEALNGLEASVASTAHEVITASRLVHDAYVARGILEPQPLGVRVTEHSLLPTTITFVAREGGVPVGTLSLTIDGPSGLPLEKIYGREVEALRAQGRRVAEVGALCVVPGRRARGISFLLYKLMWLTAARLGIEDLVIAVHPDAAFLYESGLLFERVGDVTVYPGLNRTALAVALRLNLTGAEARFHREFGSRHTLLNPYYLFAQRHEPALTVPSTSRLARHAWARRAAAQQLARALQRQGGSAEMLATLELCGAAA